ncbi:PREDICTED: thioredoxin domain-containing protein 11-like, partial [Priapulus caudatus]|uniref:Thioredoxin domain-containing protein 11-like n=1 Tax=Priapulus caudatus TaxID=37621 RepID=A0ABM1EP63_PRICU
MAAPSEPDSATEEDDDNNVTSKRKTHYLYLIMSYRNTLCFAVSFIVTMVTMNPYNALRFPAADSSQSGRPAHSFFPTTSPVRDIYTGDMRQLAEEAKTADVAFVMYYAPWDADCLQARSEFMRTAQLLHNEVHFLAVNCWETSGICRKANTITSYPVLMLYPTWDKNSGIEYLGPVIATYMVKFLEVVVRPIIPLHTLKDVSTFVEQYDSVVLARFDFTTSPIPLGYGSYYLASIRAVAKSVFQPVRFGLVMSELWNTIGIDPFHNICLTRALNQTLIWPRTHTYTSEKLANWVLYYSMQHVHWVAPSGVKSQQLSAVMGDMPTLLLFTAFNPLSDFNNEYSMLREVVLQYGACATRGQQLDKLVAAIAAQRRRVQRVQREVQRACTRHRSTLAYDHAAAVAAATMMQHACCQSVVAQPQPNVTALTSCDLCALPLRRGGDDLDLCGATSVALASSRRRAAMSAHPAGCSELRPSYGSTHVLVLCCSSLGRCHGNAASTYDLFLREDYRILKADSLNRTCSRQTFAKKEGLRLASAVHVHEPHVQIEGLRCRTNKTLRFLAMDSVRYGMFASKLGAQLSSEKTAAVIVDKQNEVQYILNSNMPTTTANLAAFIANFTEGHLTRHLRSTTVPSSSDRSNKFPEYLRIQEVTSDTFHDVVLNDEVDVLLLYYAPWCGACSGFAHVYLSLAHYFRRAENLVLARINADMNDLPWQYTVEQYPTLIFFPAK